MIIGSAASELLPVWQTLAAPESLRFLEEFFLTSDVGEQVIPAMGILKNVPSENQALRDTKRASLLRHTLRL